MEEATRDGITCSVCGKPTTGEAFPGAIVTHIECMMEATEDLRKEGPE